MCYLLVAVVADHTPRAAVTLAGLAVADVGLPVTLARRAVSSVNWVPEEAFLTQLTLQPWNNNHSVMPVHMSHGPLCYFYCAWTYHDYINMV